MGHVRDGPDKPVNTDQEFHVPLFMAKTPWYMDTGSGSTALDHQRKPRSKKALARLDDWYERGTTTGPASKRYRKGACENCGAMTHPTKECLERPRRRGARWTGKDIRPDEHLQDLSSLDYAYDAKRDTWNGYDPATHKFVVRQFEAVEAERQRMREAELDAGVIDRDAGKKRQADDDFSSSSEEDEELAPSHYVKKKTGGGGLNLRIREDRAKYLDSLDPDAPAQYDPKSRSMHDIQTEDPTEGFQRPKGPKSMQDLQQFAWEAESRGNDLIHMQANPTINELQYREYREAREKQQRETQSSILERYGGAEHLAPLPEELRTGQTEAYVEYSASGQVIKGQETARANSRYEEDVYENNHTSVWGSWYNLERAVWGYACCHNTIPRSYCTGQAGIEAQASA